MKLFETKDYSKPVSTQLSEYLKMYTTLADREKIAKKHKISLITINSVIYMSRNITANNAAAITEIVQIAIKNKSKINLEF